MLLPIIFTLSHKVPTVQIIYCRIAIIINDVTITIDTTVIQSNNDKKIMEQRSHEKKTRDHYIQGG